ncbi:LysR family transcriptional regulator [Mesorhizobium sp. B2-3-5]|uniref:LysR family transcriptional regulator n=1 Tax=Mesorhizobium sp. B2-3-5 TaxID=2589958 RepID=UPI00112C7A40|nr:LysR family transcriptional regulator [Mesorhizobium sp. B2-3-5]TPM26929.1 LysR family transcriptional regulator [Mesorhizobium sp. B2-3-5]
MLDRFTGLQVLLRTVELGSLSAAARAMGMSPTMVTKHVAALEEHLGVRLLHRTTRRVTPTNIGRAYLDVAERILAELEDADAAATAKSLVVKGLLRVSIPVSFGASQIAPLIPAFSALHPELTVDLGLNDRLVDIVEEGWDMAIRIGRLANSSLVARKLTSCQLLLCASPAYLEKHGRPYCVADLRAHACLGYTLSQVAGTASWSFGANAEVTVPISGPLRASNGDALVEAATAGLGIIYQPTFIVARPIATGELVRLELDHPPVDLGGVYAVYPPAERPPAKTRVFIDFLIQHFAGTP